MSKFLPPILILIFSISICRTEDPFYADIVNVGNAILKITDNPGLAFTKIEALWSDLFFSNNSWLDDHINVDISATLLSMSRSTIAECSETSAQNGEAGTNCTSDIKRIVQSINDFVGKINEINERIENIDRMYRTVFTTTNTEESAAFFYTDNLYNFLVEICDNRSTCIFHHVAGKHFPSIDMRHARTSSGLTGEVYNVYLIIIFHFLKGYVAEMYRIDDSFSKSQAARMKELCQSKFLMHAHVIGQKALSALKDTPSYIVREEPTDATSGSAYFQLRWFISRIIVSEANLSPSGSCRNSCRPSAIFSQWSSVSILSSGGDLMCHGQLTHCRVQPEGYVYPTTDRSRRYEGVKLLSGAIFGNIANGRLSTAKKTTDLYYAQPDGNVPCAICTCLCDDHRSPHTLRTFSLKEVTTNIEENMVITGLRLVEMNGMIYLSIRQGKLTNFGRVKNVTWVDVKTFDKSLAHPSDYFEIRPYSRQNVHLDTISVADDYVQDHILQNDFYTFLFPNDRHLLTGVKFINDGNVLRFGIRLNAWSSAAKQIARHKWNNWIFNTKIMRRKQIQFRNPDVPTKTTGYVEFMDNDYDVSFGPTDDVKDFGQTTIPFLDGRPVVTDPPMPLSGAGLFFKGKQGYGGVIGLKLVAIDFSDLIVTELQQY